MGPYTYYDEFGNIKFVYFGERVDDMDEMYPILSRIDGEFDANKYIIVQNSPQEKS